MKESSLTALGVMFRMPAWALFPWSASMIPIAPRHNPLWPVSVQSTARTGYRLRLDERRRVQHPVAEKPLHHGAFGVDGPEALDRDGQHKG